MYKKKSYKMITCADGFNMSVQAGAGSYSDPRKDGAKKYTACEVGFPSQKESMLMRYAENADEPTETVYGWVPSETITLVCAKHGGIVSGELPPGVIHLPATTETKK